MEMEMKWKLETEMERQPLSFCWLLFIGLPEISAPPVFDHLLHYSSLVLNHWYPQYFCIGKCWGVNGLEVSLSYRLCIEMGPGYEDIICFTYPKQWNWKWGKEAAKVRMWPCFKTRWNYSHGQVTITECKSNDKAHHLWERKHCTHNWCIFVSISVSSFHFISFSCFSICPAT